jgi:hypothetical protein
MITHCSVDGCGRRVQARGWCQMHYFRWRRHGDPLAPRSNERGVCTIEGCASPHSGLGWCKAHYDRWLRWGDPTYVPPASWPETYGGMHKRVGSERGSASHLTCECGAPAEHWAYDHQDPDERQSPRGPFSLKVEHYHAMCVPCHKVADLARCNATRQQLPVEEARALLSPITTRHAPARGG